MTQDWNKLIENGNAHGLLARGAEIGERRVEIIRVLIKNIVPAIGQRHDVAALLINTVLAFIIADKGNGKISRLQRADTRSLR